MGHLSGTIAFRVMLLAGSLGVVGSAAALAQQGRGQQGGQDQQNWQRGPVYQRQAFDGKNKGGSGHGDFRRRDHRFQQPFFPNVQSNWFTRPYPYHLDFYKMKYGGSYAPYFGNLYGPPQVVTAPPYFGPYYGGWGMGTGGGGYEGGAPNGFNGVNGFNGLPPEGVVEGPLETINPNNQPAAQPNGESLPVPGQ